MPWTITRLCRDCLDTGCVSVCPVDCIYEYTGSDTEKSTYKGKDSSGKYVWTDVFVERNGRWQAVASQSTKATN